MYGNNDFKKYATSNLGIPTTTMDAYGKHMDQGNLTPYILEERKLNVTQMDVFSRMLGDRIIWVSGEVNDTMSSIVSAQLMYLDSVGDTDITLQISSPGGSVTAGLTMVDIMNYVSSDIMTVNIGMAASMGSILLGNGTKGKRFILPNARTMLHKVSSGTQGQIDNMEVAWLETKKYNEKLFNLLGEYCGKDPKQVLDDCRLDFWLNADESVAYGIADKIMVNKIKG